MSAWRRPSSGSGSSSWRSASPAAPLAHARSEQPDGVVRCSPTRRRRRRSGRRSRRRRRAVPGLTGIEPLADGRVALALRLALLRNARARSTSRPFIWHADNAGTLLYEEVLRAASAACACACCSTTSTRRASIRWFALLDAEPNVQLRLYNPSPAAASRGLGILGDFERLNRRMHNKSLTVDNQATIVGGRNIADEYFETGEGPELRRLRRPRRRRCGQAVSAQFDVYWNSGSAYPARLIVPREPAADRVEFAARARATPETPIAARTRRHAAHAADPVAARGVADFEWTTARVVHDDPEKTLAESRDERRLQLLPELIATFGRRRRNSISSRRTSCPGRRAPRRSVALARRGVRVRILTNSLAGTDEVSVHSGYARRRKDLLRAGVELFEIKPSAAPILQRGQEVGKHSTAGLHAKTFAVDRARSSSVPSTSTRARRS
jgi:putative cardiolipin synthase